MPDNGRFYGKYRGKVASSDDPLRLGRLQVEVPAVLGDTRLAWAMPCVPFAGPLVGWFALPAPGANVWAEFEGGDPDYPIWSGCFWGAGELPGEATSDRVVLLKTDDVSIVVEAGQGVKVSVGADPVVLAITTTGVTVSRRGTTVASFSDDTISLAARPARLELSNDGKAVLGDDAGAMTVSQDGVELKHAASSVKVSNAGVALASGAGKADVTPTTVELAHGASSVKLTPVTVNVNNGALEVM